MYEKNFRGANLYGSITLFLKMFGVYKIYVCVLMAMYGNIPVV
jgi:hypothetical protein